MKTHWHRTVVAFIAATALQTPSALADTPVDTQPAPAARSRVAVTFAYYGDTLAHPGLLSGVEYTLLDAHRVHAIVVRGHLGGYVHPRLYVATFAGAELAYRVTAASGLRAEIAAGLGYLHTFLASDVYETTPTGPVSPSNNWGSSHLMPSVSVGMGWDFGRRTRWPLALTLRTQLFAAYPHNGSWLLHVAVIPGISYEL